MAEQTDAERLADANEQLIGTVENGPWVLIPDPALRELVGEYVADTCHSVAIAAGLDKAMERAHDMTPQRLGTSLPGSRVVPDARERLARHLWLADADAGSGNSNARLWDGHAIDRTAWLDKADEVLNLVTHKED